MTQRHDPSDPPDPSASWQEPQVSQHLQTWRRLLPLGTAEIHTPRGTLFVQGASADSVLLLVEGLVKLSYTLANGQECILGLRFPGQLVGKNAALLHVPHRVSAITVTTCHIHRVPVSQLRKVLEESFEAAWFLLCEQALDHHQASTALIDLKLQPARSRLLRLARQLIAILGRIGLQSPQRLHDYLTDHEIAALIGISPEHLCRLKKQIQAEDGGQEAGRLLGTFARSHALFGRKTK